jgi:hypothetical protein
MTAPLKKKQAHVWERGEHDWYCEPSRASEALFRVEKFESTIWDPACGKGAIVLSAIGAGYNAIGTDIVDRNPVEPEWFYGEHDFLLGELEPLAPNIVTNPPFYRAKGAEAFIRKALSLTTGKVCAFVDIHFVAGDGRATGLFKEHPPTRIWIIHPRVSCPPGEYLEAGGKAGNGSSDWCWIVWSKEEPHSGTELRWLNVNEARANARS